MAYPGGKAGPGTYQRIINHMPPHQVYIEPFLGAGAVLKHKRPAAENIGIEIDPEVLAAHWGNQARYRTAGRDEDAGDTAGEGDEGLQPARTIQRYHHDEDGEDGRTAATDSGGAEHRQPASPTTRTGNDGEALTILHGDGLQYLRERDWRGDELVYCDPPYLPGTRTGGPLYRCEMTVAQHEELLAIVHHLRARGVSVLVSGYHSKLYARELKGWTLTTFGNMTRRGMALEHLWMGFPEPVALHDYRYLGEDYRERERIKKKVGRWTAKLADMPKLERQALLAALVEAESQTKHTQAA